MIVGFVEQLLREKMGLDSRSIGTAAIERAIRDRLQTEDLDEQRYWSLLCASEVEQQALIEAVVVPETWFFRDSEAFVTLTQLANREWLPANACGTLRVLSAPCATGEEPYSAAMALVDSGFPADRFLIDAIDISARSIRRAETGLYSNNSFRCGDLGFRKRHFEREGPHYRLSDLIRGHVRFRQSNLFAHGAFPAIRVYDAIFCRNVLIYFDPPAQQRAIELLAGLLTPTGVLFVGPAEAPLLARHGFHSTRVPLAFAFRRITRPAAGRSPTDAQPASSSPSTPSTRPDAKPAGRVVNRRTSSAHSEARRQSPVRGEASGQEPGPGA